MKERILFVLLGFITIFVLWGCASATYVAPKSSNEIKNYSRVINKSYDDTWKALIEYSASTFFSIDNFEKASGLLTLSFGASNPSEFVTGGQWNASSLNNHFSGDYADYLVQYQNGILNGKMNIVVSQIDSSHTKVTVNARYIFTAIAVYDNRNYTNTWSFDSGNCGTINVSLPTRGTQPQRTICPTYKAESEVLKAIESL